MTEATAQEITITRVFDAPRAAVWAAWTQPEQLAQWWGPDGWSTPAGAVTMDVRPGGEFSVVSRSEDGQEMPVRGVYKEVAAPERLVLEEDAEGAWHDGAVSEVELVDLGGSRTEMRFRATIRTTGDAASGAEAGLSGAFDRLEARLGAGAAPAGIAGIDFITLPTRDIHRAMDFYENVLGLQPSKRWQRGEEEPLGAEFENGTVTIALFAVEKAGLEFAPHSTPIAFRVDDVPAAKARLEARGVEFKSDLIDSGSCHQAIFTDPDGNALGLHHIYARSQTPSA